MGFVVAVSKHSEHCFSKQAFARIDLIKGLGVAGDAHAGKTVKHRSRVAVDPTQPNLRQVHLIHAELLDELSAQGFTVAPADLGENILTRGVDLLSLPKGTRLRIGETAEVKITGLRNPCAQIEQFQKGLVAAVLIQGPEGEIIRKTGVMSVVTESGSVSVGDQVSVEMPPPPHQALEKV